MEVNTSLAKTMKLKEMMEHANYCIGSLAHVYSFINEVIDLSGYGLTTDTKDCTFPWSQEIHGSWLKRVIRIEDLLRHIKTVMGEHVIRIGWLR